MTKGLVRFVQLVDLVKSAKPKFKTTRLKTVEISQFKVKVKTRRFKPKLKVESTQSKPKVKLDRSKLKHK